MSNSLQPRELQRSRIPCPSLSRSLRRLMPIESVIPSSHLILCCSPLLLLSILPSIWVFSNELALHIRWPKYWSFSISPSSEYSGLLSFRIDWFECLAVQGTLDIVVCLKLISCQIIIPQFLKKKVYSSQVHLLHRNHLTSWNFY